MALHRCSYKRFRLKTAAILIAAILSLGCITASPALAKTQLTETPMTELSSDVKLVLASILQQFRTNPSPVEGVRFDPGGRHALRDENVNYDMFSISNINISKYEVTPLATDIVRAVMEIQLLFRDELGRKAQVAVATQYVVFKGGINIERSAALVIPPRTPELETYYVPATAFKKALAGKTTYADYYLTVLAMASPMTDIPGVTPQKKKEKYLIITLCKDLLPPNSFLEMKVTSKPRRLGTRLARPVNMVIDNSWRIIVAGGTFQIASRASKFYTTISYAMQEGEDKPVIVASYDNTRDPAPKRPAAVQPTAKPQPRPTAPAAVSATQGPLELGTTMLNPVFLEDVQVLHKRLNALGYYNGPIDHEYDAATIKALDAFAVRNGFPAGQWSLSLQKVLFTGSGL